MADFAIGTVGIKMLYLALVIPEVLQNVLQDMLHNHPIVLPLGISLFGRNISHLHWNR
jgi:hypothetical protein